MIGMVLVVLLLLGFIAERNCKRLAVRLDVHCPECQVLLAGPVGRFAVTTLSCRQCGSKVLEDD